MDCEITYLKPYGVLLEPKDNRSLLNLDVGKLKQFFNKEQIILLRGFDGFKTAEDFSDYCERWGEVSLWPFGKVLELVQQEEPEDHIFDNSYMPMHWDGMYRPQVPEYQIFQCVQAPPAGQGGRTTFSNTLLALEHAPAEHIELWKKARGIYQRKMAFYHSKTTSPIITKHPQKDYFVIRYNEPHMEEKGDFVNPPDMEFTGIAPDEMEKLHSSLRQALYGPKSFYAHEWQTGDVVICDNFTLLHGREAFVSNSKRHLRRVQVLSSPPFDNPSLESYQ